MQPRHMWNRGANRGFATRPRWENENSHSPHPRWREFDSPDSAGHPSRDWPGWGGCGERYIIIFVFCLHWVGGVCIGLVVLGINMVKKGNVYFY